MADIQWGNIEILVGDESTGVPITPLFPFNPTSSVSSQIKSRTGVQIGAKQPDLVDGEGTVLTGSKGVWTGTTKGGATCEVRVWETAGA